MKLRWYFGVNPIGCGLRIMTKTSPRSRKATPESGQEHDRRDPIGTPPGRLAEAPEPADPALALESAQYIAQMSAELAAMARSAKGEPYWIQVFGTPR